MPFNESECYSYKVPSNMRTLALGQLPRDYFKHIHISNPDGRLTTLSFPGVEESVVDVHVDDCKFLGNIFPDFGGLVRGTLWKPAWNLEVSKNSKCSA